MGEVITSARIQVTAHKTEITERESGSALIPGLIGVCFEWDRQREGAVLTLGNDLCPPVTPHPADGRVRQRIKRAGVRQTLHILLLTHQISSLCGAYFTCRGTQQTVHLEKMCVPSHTKKPARIINGNVFTHCSLVSSGTSMSYLPKAVSLSGDTASCNSDSFVFLIL